MSAILEVLGLIIAYAIGQQRFRWRDIRQLLHGYGYPEEDINLAWAKLRRQRLKMFRDTFWIEPHSLPLDTDLVKAVVVGYLRLHAEANPVQVSTIYQVGEPYFRSGSSRGNPARTWRRVLHQAVGALLEEGVIRCQQPRSDTDQLFIFLA